MLALNVPANHSYVQDYDLTVIYGGGGDGGGASDEKAAEPVTCVLSIWPFKTGWTNPESLEH